MFCFPHSTLLFERVCRRQSFMRFLLNVFFFTERMKRESFAKTAQNRRVCFLFPKTEIKTINIYTNKFPMLSDEEIFVQLSRAIVLFRNFFTAYFASLECIGAD
ncbi:hypothetical protein ACFFRR_008130 [Megaselia abdita]